jgi:dTDP-D-glucose 4,6-dehydratase
LISSGEAYNIGTDFEISNIELARKLIQMFGYNEDEYIIYVEDRPFNDLRSFFI